MSFKEEMQKKTAETENVILKFLPEEKGYQKTVLEAINYSVRAGGKRLRPLLMQESFRLFGGNGESIKPFMAAMEMIHTYSLVHDDLPAMDDDEYRRGRKTTHVVFGEAMGILAGDGLLNLAFETAAEAFSYGEDMERAGKALKILAEKAGINGMLGGQVADIEGITDISDKDKLLFIYEKKTSALIEASLMIGAVLAGASDEAVASMEQIGKNIGVAFQIQDDILDITGTSEILGKPVGSDEKNEKITYVSVYGMKQAKNDVERISLSAMKKLEELETENNKEFLSELIQYLIVREK